MTSISERLRKWSSCDIADGLSKLGHKHGGFLEGLTMYSPEFQSGATRIAGRVFTVKFASKGDTTSPKFQGNYVDTIPKDSVVFISQPEPHINAVYGGLMSLRAQMLGAQGVIIDGRLRDLQEHRDLKFPIFAKGVGTTAGGAVCFPSATEVPVKFNSQHQEAWINPTDYIIADLDGVVVIPEDLVEKVLEMVPGLVQADEKCAEAIRNGSTVQAAFKEFRGGSGPR